MMNSTLSKILLFVSGAAVGSVVTWKLLKTKYELIAQEEIDAVRDFYSDKMDEIEGYEEVSDDEKTSVTEYKTSQINEKPDLMKYAATIKDLGYSEDEETDSDEDDDEYYEQEENDVDDRPHVISPDELGEDESYEIIELIHFADDVLTDDDYEIIDDIDGAVGIDYARHFGEYEPDSVCVRNDKRQCYYEILRDERNFEDL